MSVPKLTSNDLRIIEIAKKMHPYDYGWMALRNRCETLEGRNLVKQIEYKKWKDYEKTIGMDKK